MIYNDLDFNYIIKNCKKMERAELSDIIIPLDSPIRADFCHQATQENETIRDFIEKVNPKIKIDDGSTCYYLPNATDTIYMVDLNRFYSKTLYYSVLFHELIHWSGNNNRLNRDGIARRNIEGPLEIKMSECRKEEIIAQLGSYYLTKHFKIDSSFFKNFTTKYIAEVLSTFKKKGLEKILTNADKQARKAVRYILSL